MTERRRYNPEDDEVKKEAGLVWGRGVPTIENHTNLDSCKNEECPTMSKQRGCGRDLSPEHIVGVRKAPYPAEHEDEVWEYAVMKECPSCQHIFWHHITRKDAVFYARHFKPKN